MAKRIDADQVHRAVKETRALLVCAYADDARSQEFRLSDALSLGEFQGEVPRLRKDRQIIFYCAVAQEATSALRADAYEAKGFTNVWALRGGYRAWRQFDEETAIL
jgi:rhodanese-related sulfurtransferase